MKFVAVILILVIFTDLTHLENVAENCSPMNSNIDYMMRTINNKHCFFPFMYDGKQYEDCVQHPRGKGRYWCPTTCNFKRDRQWSYCMYKRKDTKEPSCKDLNETRAHPLLFTKANRKCMIPFVYKGKCMHDCIKDSHYWCALTPSYDLNAKEYDYCTTTLKALNETPTCSNFNDYKLHVQPETESGMNQCYFPFYQHSTGECSDECTASSDGYWCPKSPALFTGSTNFVGCRYLKNLDIYGKYLVYGLYEIRSFCNFSDFCNKSVITNVNGKYLSVAKEQEENEQITIWEILPQPGNSIIIREPTICGSTKNEQTQWSINSDGFVVMSPMKNYKKNIRFVLDPAPNGNDTYILKEYMLAETKTKFRLAFDTNIDTNNSLSRLLWSPFQIPWQFSLFKKFNTESTENCIPGASTTTSYLHLSSSNGKITQVVVTKIKSHAYKMTPGLFPTVIIIGFMYVCQQLILS